MPKSRKAKSLSLRRISYKADARMRRKVAAREATLMATPEGRFFFGREWTPEQISEMRRPDGFITLPATEFNRLPIMFNGRAN
jgi:hypothetical protein